MALPVKWAAIMVTLRSIMKPKIIRKRTEKLIGTSQINTSKVVITGENSEVLTAGVEEIQRPDPDAQHQLWEQPGNKARAAQWLLEVPVDDKEPYLPGSLTFPPRTAGPRGKSSLLAISHQSQCQATQLLCTFRV